MEDNFARQDGEPFDPMFFLSGELEPDGIYWVEDDIFIDQIVGSIPPAVSFVWHGRNYRVAPPEDASCRAS